MRRALRICAGWIFVPLLWAAEGAGPTSITSQQLLKDITILASDEFEGRGPGSRGEERTTMWLAEQFKAAGLSPGGPNGSWFQEVPMVGIRSTFSAATRSSTSR